MSTYFSYTPKRRGGVLAPLARLIAALDLAVSVSIVGLIAVMVAVVSTQVALRYLFNHSLDWADELARLCFVWSMFIAIPLGLKSGAHIGIEMLVVRLPAALRGALARCVAVLGAGVLLLVAWESAVIAWDQWDELLASLPASAGWFIVPVAVAGVHGALHLLWQAATGAAHAVPLLSVEPG